MCCRPSRTLPSAHRGATDQTGDRLRCLPVVHRSGWTLRHTRWSCSLEGYAGFSPQADPMRFRTALRSDRIEDIVTVTDDGGRRLNNTSHELRTVA